MKVTKEVKVELAGEETRMLGDIAKCAQIRLNDGLTNPYSAVYRQEMLELIQKILDAVY